MGDSDNKDSDSTSTSTTPSQPSFMDKLKKLSIKQYILIGIGLAYSILGLIALAGILGWGRPVDLTLTRKAVQGMIIISTFAVGYTAGKMVALRSCTYESSIFSKKEVETINDGLPKKENMDILGGIGGAATFGLAVTILTNLDKAEPNTKQMKDAATGICVMGGLTFIYAALFSVDKFKKKDKK